MHPTDAHLPHLFVTVMGLTGLRYLVFAGLGWLLGYLVFPRRWRHRKIIAGMPGRGAVWWEIRHSLLSIAIFAVIGWATLIASQHGLTALYRDVDARGWAWLWTSVLLAVLLHDTWFYWTHRLLHHRALFRFHAAHHRSTNPTPWAAYSFSPLEAVVQAAIFPLVVFLIPIHPLALALFLLWQIVFNVIGHSGYEYNHRRFIDSPLHLVLNTPTNHIMHHERMSRNFGLYFNVWDRLMGTNHSTYEQRFREVTSRAPASPVATETTSLPSRP